MEKMQLNLKSECMTKETGADGKRHQAYSEWQSQTVPEGYVINEKSVKATFESKAGSENRCDFEFGDYVEVIPGTGLEQPRTIKTRAYARGPAVTMGGRGWTKCHFTGEYVKYQQ